jgi:haloalkane dehalogenase
MADHSANLGQVLDELGVGDFVLVAHDWGGAIGAHAAVRDPGRVKGMVFLNTAAFPARRMPWQIRLARSPVLGRFLVERCNAFAAGAFRKGVVRELAPAVADGFRLPWIDRRARRAISAFVEDIPRGPRHPSWDSLREAETGLASLADKPCLLAWGMKDFCFDESFLGEWIRRFPEAETERFAEAGHYVLEDAGEALVSRIEEFVCRVRETAS